MGNLMDRLRVIGEAIERVALVVARDLCEAKFIEDCDCQACQILLYKRHEKQTNQKAKAGQAKRPRSK